MAHFVVDCERALVDNGQTISLLDVCEKHEAALYIYIHYHWVGHVLCTNRIENTQLFEWACIKFQELNLFH